jgi:hypothetical protein
MPKYRPKSPIISQQFKKQPEKVFAHAYDSSLSGNAGGAMQQARAAGRNPRVVDFQTHSFRSTQILVTNNAQIIIAANPARRYLLIQNKTDPPLNPGSQNTIQLAFGTLAFSDTQNGLNSIDLPPGTNINWEGVVPNNEISAVCLPTSVITIVEGMVDGFDDEYQMNEPWEQ